MSTPPNMKDGVYDAVAVAHLADKTELSQHEIFYVLNSAPTAMPLSVSIVTTGESGKTADVTDSVSDRIVFNLVTNSAPVPYCSLTFHVVQNGKEVYTKGANIVVQRV